MTPCDQDWHSKIRVTDTPNANRANAKVSAYISIVQYEGLPFCMLDCAGHLLRRDVNFVTMVRVRNH